MENLDYRVKAALKVTTGIIHLLSFHYTDEEDIYVDDKDWKKMVGFIVPSCEYIEETINAIETVSTYTQKELLKEYIILCVGNAYLFKEHGVMLEDYAANIFFNKLLITDLNSSDAKNILGKAEDLCLDIWDNDELWETQLEDFKREFNKLARKRK